MKVSFFPASCISKKSVDCLKTAWNGEELPCSYLSVQRRIWMTATGERTLPSKKLNPLGSQVQKINIPSLFYKRANAIFDPFIRIFEIGMSLKERVWHLKKEKLKTPEKSLIFSYNFCLDYVIYNQFEIVKNNHIKHTRVKSKNNRILYEFLKVENIKEALLRIFKNSYKIQFSSNLTKLCFKWLFVTILNW